MGRNPLFDVMFVLQNMDMGQIEIEGLRFDTYDGGHKISKFDMTLSATESGREIDMYMEYCTKLFAKETVERMAKHLINILLKVTENIDIELYKIDMLDDEEKHKLLYGFNGTHAEYPKDKTIHQLFEEQVDRTPDNIAVVFEDERLTYRELNGKANSLARELREKGVGPDKIVGIMVERSMEMIIGIMGILKAGGAYLPIDPDYPEDRISYMLDDSGAVILLSQGKFMNKNLFIKKTLQIDEKQYQFDSTYLENINNPKDLAYIIYTSGTTGKPKAVMIEHGNVVNLVYWFNARYDLRKNKRVLQMTNYIFDPSVEQIFSSLLKGACIYCIKKETILKKSKFIEYIEESKINMINFTPSTLRELIAGVAKINNLNVIV